MFLSFLYFLYQFCFKLSLIFYLFSVYLISFVLIFILLQVTNVLFLSFSLTQINFSLSSVNMENK